MTFTVILPHRRNPGNDSALSICIDCLMKNTVNDFRLLMDAAFDQPLNPRVNRMVEEADTDCCLYLASDTFLGPRWDVDMLANFDERTFVTDVLVEPGAICPHPQNIHRDFGRRPDSFRRAEFEAWCNGEARELNILGEGWFAPVMFSRKGWLAFGGLSTASVTDHQGFTSADEELFGRWKAAGNRVVRARLSYAYHLQRYSVIEEQEAAKRQ